MLYFLDGIRRAIERATLLRRAEAMKRLQGRDRLRNRRVVANSGRDAGFSIFRISELVRSTGCPRGCDRISDRAGPFLGLRDNTGRSEMDGRGCT